MKKIIAAAAIFAAAIPSMAQVSVNIHIGEPDYYGRIDTRSFAPPPVYVSQPVIIERTVHYRDEPVYLRVPPGHRKKWSKHCHRYNACGQRVLFVQDGWYSNTYAPRVREVSYRGDGRRDGGRRHHDHDDDRRGHGKDRDHDRGHGKGHGHGKDKH